VDASGAELPKAREQIESPVELPYSKYFDAARSVMAASVERQATANRLYQDQYEEVVAACMKEAGFQYVPRPFESDDGEEYARDVYPQGNTLDVPWLPETLEETERVGYGVISAGEYIGDDQFESPISDKNIAYAESLSASGRRAYNLALYGYEEDFHQIDDPDNCTARASARVAVPEPEELLFLDTLDSMWAVMGGPDVAFDFETREVVVDDGGAEGTLWANHDYQRLMAEYGSCLAELDQRGLIGDWFGATDFSAQPMGMFSLAAATSREGSVFVYDGVVGTEAIPEDQRSLVGSQVERDIAVLDFKCRQETDYVDRYTQIIYELQESYIAEHQADVGKLEAAIEQYLSGGKPE
jgi:hypothetical protein